MLAVLAVAGLQQGANLKVVQSTGLLWKVESDPLGRERCAGEPVLRRWSSPRFIRHSGLADTAHRTDCRVEPLFIECWFNQR